MPIKSVMNRLFFTCEHSSYLIDRDLMEKLPPLTRFRLWMHLRYCQACRKFKQQSQRLEEFLKMYIRSGYSIREMQKMDAETKDKMRQELKKRLSD